MKIYLFLILIIFIIYLHNIKEDYNNFDIIEEDYIISSIIVIIVCSFTAFLSITTWVFFGKFLRKFATNNNFIKRFNYAMSILIITCIIGFYI